LTFQFLYFSPDGFQLFVVMRFKRLVSFLLQLSDFLFHGTLVQAFHYMVFPRLDSEGLTDRFDERLLRELRIALHGRVVQFGSDLLELSNGFDFNSLKV